MTDQMTAEATPIGPYTVRVYGCEEILNSEETRFEYEIAVKKAEDLITKLQLAVSSIKHRQLVDAVCGNCKLCENTRMVSEKRPNGQSNWIEHCPKCKPKIQKARASGLLT